MERRRRWSAEQKLAIVSEIGIKGAGVAEVARRHAVGGRQIYQWRCELVRKGLITVEPAVFLPIAMEGRAPGASAKGSAHPVEKISAERLTVDLLGFVPRGQRDKLLIWFCKVGSAWRPERAN